MSVARSKDSRLLTSVHSPTEPVTVLAMMTVPSQLKTVMGTDLLVKKTYSPVAGTLKLTCPTFEGAGSVSR